MTAPAFSLTDHLRTVRRPGAVARAVARLLGRPTPSVAVNGWYPRNDNIAVLPLAEADRTAGGIVLAETVRERPQKGVVVAIGPGLYDPERERVLPVETAVGDLVVFGKYAGVTFELSDNLHVFIMRNVEFMAARPEGTYTLVEHVVDAGTPRERRTYHEEGMLCEHCPTTALDAERARHRAAVRMSLRDQVADEAEMKRLLDEAPSPAPPVAEPPAADPLAATGGDLDDRLDRELDDLIDGAAQDAVVIERVETLAGRRLTEAETGLLAMLLAEMAARRIPVVPGLDSALVHFLQHHGSEFEVSGAYVEAALRHITEYVEKHTAAPSLAEERAKFQAEQRAALHEQEVAPTVVAERDAQAEAAGRDAAAAAAGDYE
ncbi:MAG: hypothetical protein AB7O67_23660 [Vicinamibacterales bacterium]